MLTWAAAGAAVAAVALAFPSPRWVADHRLGVRAGPRSRRPVAVAAGVAVVVAAQAVLERPALTVLAIVAVGLGAFALRQHRASVARADRWAAREESAEIVDLLAAELRAGVLVHQALVALAGEFAVLVPVASAARHGADVTVALREVASAPGREAFADLAGAWFVADRSGAPLAGVLDRLAASVRDDLEILREVQSGIAPARASGRLMAVLPLVGLVLGSGMGADPLRFITGSVVGAACVAVGAALACLGVVWIDRVARRAEVV